MSVCLCLSLYVIVLYVNVIVFYLLLVIFFYCILLYCTVCYRIALYVIVCIANCLSVRFIYLFHYIEGGADHYSTMVSLVPHGTKNRSKLVFNFWSYLVDWISEPSSSRSVLSYCQCPSVSQHQTITDSVSGLT